METRLEQILQRAISVVRYLTKSREYALTMLLGWEGTRTCRLAVEAVVSCAIRADSVLRERALEWVRQERESPLVHACLLDIAKRSETRRGQVLGLMDELEVELLLPARSVWQAMRKTTPSWPDIAKACGARWENFPAERTLLEASFAVMEDNPKEDFSILLGDVLSHDLGEMPELRGQIAKLAFNTPDVASVVVRHAGMLAEELAEFLVVADDPRRHPDDSGVDAKILWAISHALASFLSQCKELSPGQRRAVELLVDTKRPCRPWVAACGALLAPLASSPDGKISFLAAAWLRRSPFVYEAIDTSELEAYIYQQSSAERITFVQKILEMDNIMSLQGALGPWMFGQIAKDATVYENILSGVLDHVTPGVMLEYLVHTEDRADAGLAQRWVDGLAKEREHPPASSRLIRYLNEMGCSLSPFLLSRWEEALKAGYQLRPDDLDYDDHKVISRLLGRESFVWENEQWRGVLLRHCPDTTVVSSFVFYAETRRRDDSISWAADILFPLCEESPALWPALLDVAWGETPSSFAQFLALRRGMSAEETALARAVVAKNPWPWLRVEHLKRGVFEKLFGADAQMNIFFAHVEGNLPAAALFENLFAEEGTRKRLLQWLIANRDAIHPVEWAKWVAHYRFVDDKRVRDHLAHVILSSARKNEVEAALAALGL